MPHFSAFLREKARPELVEGWGFGLRFAWSSNAALFIAAEGCQSHRLWSASQNTPAKPNRSARVYDLKISFAGSSERSPIEVLPWPPFISPSIATATP